ncbi:MAG: ankyrin repeat domain-containing protein, partial [Nitrospina sp.]
MVRFRITYWYLVLLILVGGFASGCSMIRSDTLENAVRAEDIKKVQNHLDANANVNQTNHNGQTPLHLAAQKGYKEVAGMLIG